MDVLRGLMSGRRRSILVGLLRGEPWHWNAPDGLVHHRDVCMSVAVGFAPTTAVP
jgi:hypothetical protein